MANMIASEYEAYPKFEPMKHRFKRKYYKSTTDSLVFRDDTDDLGRDKRYLRSKKRHNGVKPKWRAKRKQQKIGKQRILRGAFFIGR